MKNTSIFVALVCIFLMSCINFQSAQAQTCIDPSNFTFQHQQNLELLLTWDRSYTVSHYEISIKNKTGITIHAEQLPGNSESHIIDYGLYYPEELGIEIKSVCLNGATSLGIKVKIATVESVIKDGNPCDFGNSDIIIDKNLNGNIYNYNSDCFCSVTTDLGNFYNCGKNYTLDDCPTIEKNCGVQNDWHEYICTCPVGYLSFFGSEKNNSYLYELYSNLELHNVLCNSECAPPSYSVPPCDDKKNIIVEDESTDRQSSVSIGKNDYRFYHNRQVLTIVPSIEKQQQFNIYIYSIDGKLVKEISSIISPNGNQEVDISAFSIGYYIVEFIANNESYSYSFIK